MTDCALSISVVERLTAIPRQPVGDALRPITALARRDQVRDLGTTTFGNRMKVIDVLKRTAAKHASITALRHPRRDLTGTWHGALALTKTSTPSADVLSPEFGVRAPALRRRFTLAISQAIGVFLVVLPKVRRHSLRVCKRPGARVRLVARLADRAKSIVPTSVPMELRSGERCEALCASFDVLILVSPPVGVKYAEAVLLGWRILRATTDQVKHGTAAEWVAKALENGRDVSDG